MLEERKLNDADVEAIVSKMEERMTERFYGDIGRGVWAITWKAIIAGLVLVAAYGSMKGFK